MNVLSKIAAAFMALLDGGLSQRLSHWRVINSNRWEDLIMQESVTSPRGKPRWIHLETHLKQVPKILQNVKDWPIIDFGTLRFDNLRKYSHFDQDWILFIKHSMNWLNLDCILAAFWLHFDWYFDWYLAAFWLVFGCILTAFWLHFDCILTVFWLHFDWILTKVNSLRNL